jgi:predicted dehydrogenase
MSATASKIDSEWERNFILYGERGTLSASAGFMKGFTVHLRGWQENTDDRIDEHTDIDFFELFQNNSVGPRQFVDAILDDQPIYPGFYEGYKVQQVIDAALESHRSGCRVTIAP